MDSSKTTFNEKEIAVLECLVNHSIYRGRTVRMTIQEIADYCEISNYMANKIIKKFKVIDLIITSHVRYQIFYTRWGKMRKKPVHTEYEIDRDKCYEILLLDKDYDPQHVNYEVEEFPGLPIKHYVSKSQTTESVYVTYVNTQTEASATMRFSNHDAPHWRMFDYVYDREDILCRLGLKSA